MSFFLGRAFRFSLRLLDGLAVIGLCAGLVATARFVFDQHNAAMDLAAATARLAHESADLAVRRPPRPLLAGAIPGNAADDYDAWCAEVRHDDPLPPRDHAGFSKLDAAERARLEGPRERAVIDRFVRAARREDLRFEPRPAACFSAIIRRPRAVRAAAIAAAARGELDLAWGRAAAVAGYADATLGRAGTLRTLVASHEADVVLDLLAELAARADPEQAKRWSADVDRLRETAMAPHDIPIAVAASTAVGVPYMRADLEPIPREALWLTSIVDLVDTGDIAGRCHEHDDLDGFCAFLASIISERVRAPARLASIARTLDLRRSAATPSRL